MSAFNNPNNTKNVLTNMLLSPTSPFNNSQQHLNRIIATSSPIEKTSSNKHEQSSISIKPIVTSNIPINTRDKASQNKNINRHTIAISHENFDNYSSPQTPNLKQHELRYEQQHSFESNNNNSSPLSKTPDSSNENWLTINDSLHGKTSSNLTGSIGNLGDSDHEMIDSNATGISGSGQECGDESADDDLDSGIHNPSASGNSTNLFYDDNDDTIKRLRTFFATTLHNERVYLDKLKKLIGFKDYLEENFNGSETDICVLFTGIQQIYLTHDIVASKLQENLSSLTQLLTTNSNINKTSPVNTRLNQVVGSSRQATNLSPTSSTPPQASNMIMKKSFLENALNLLASIMEISFPVYLEFLKNYPKSMTILNKLEKQPNQKTNMNMAKRKTFIECQAEYSKLLGSKETSSMNETNQHKEKRSAGFLIRTNNKQSSKDPYDLYYNDVKKSEEKFDLTKIFTEDILRRPTKLFEFIFSLKDECLQASRDLSASVCAELKSNIKSLFENEASKSLREKVSDEINRNIMPKEVRKNEDVVELIENNNDRKLRHLILYGDCLVCCRLKKDKRQLKWFIPIDQLEIFTDEYKSAKSENELRHLKEEVVSLRSNLKKQTEENASAKNQQKIKKKLAEQENELAIQSSKLKLIVRANPSLSSSSSMSSSTTSNTLGTGFFSNGSFAAAISSSMNNLANLTGSSLNSSKTSSSNNSGNSSNLHHHHYHYHHHHGNNSGQLNSSSPLQTSFSSSSTFVFLFTSDFERNAWLEEINGAIHALKSRKTTINLQQSDIESRINNLKKIEEPPKVITSSYTGSLELLVKKLEILEQPNKVYVAVELKSCGSYLEVAQTRCSELTTNPIWEEKFNLELQSVDSLRIILYSQTSGKALAIASQELKIDSNVNINKINCVKLTNGITLHISMKFLSPKKTITRRRTRNRNDIFGGNLADLLQREKSTIPRILKDCVEVIETKGIEEVGIYRVSSVVSEVQKMKDLYSRNPNQALNELRQKSPHLSANVLKLYLRELPDPLFTSPLYHRFMNAVECQIPEFRLNELCRVFNELPEPNKNIILFILTHLLNIANYSDKNMMSIKNLCTLFGPTLMKLSPKDNLQVEDMNKEINESMQQAQVLFYILQLHSEGKLIHEQNETHLNKTDNNNLIDNQTMDNFSRLNIKNMPSGQYQSINPNFNLNNSKQIIDSNNNNINNNQNKTQQQQQQQQQQNQPSGFTKISMQTAL